MKTAEFIRLMKVPGYAVGKSHLVIHENRFQWDVACGRTWGKHEHIPIEEVEYPTQKNLCKDCKTFLEEEEIQKLISRENDTT